MNPSLKSAPQQHQPSPTQITSCSCTPSFSAANYRCNQYLILPVFCVGKEKDLVKRVQKSKLLVSPLIKCLDLAVTVRDGHVGGRYVLP